MLFPRFEAYSAYSRIIMATLGTLSELIEPLSIDEAFVDLEAGPLADDPAAAATDVRARIRELTGLAVSIGIGRSKLVAKLASDAGEPDGLLVVEPADEDDVLLPLPVRRCPASALRRPPRSSASTSARSRTCGARSSTSSP